MPGAKASAIVYSLVLTCRALRVEPLAWLRHVLAELPQDLLPFNFLKTAAARPGAMRSSESDQSSQGLSTCVEMSAYSSSANKALISSSEMCFFRSAKALNRTNTCSKVGFEGW